MTRASFRRFARPVVALLALSLTPALAGGARWLGSPFEGWTPAIGAWQAKGDILGQSTTKADCRVFAPLADWTDYVLTCKARKLGGGEGFLILFRVKDHAHFYWWNVAGWGNSRHAVETRPQRVFDSKPGRVQTGRWYDIRIVVQGPSIKCYLDGKLVHDIQNKTYPRGGIGLGSWSTQVEYKDVSVTTLDGQKLLGAEPMELVRSALDGLGGAGAPFRKEYDALRKAKAPPGDVRWAKLYARVAALREKILEAKARLGKIDLGTPRAKLEELVEQHLSTRPQAEALLKQMPGHAAALDAARAAVAAGRDADWAAVAAAQDFVGKVTALRQSLYTSRCPPVAFILRQPHTRHGTNATMHVRVHGRGSAIAIIDPPAQLRAGPSGPEQKPKVIFDDPQGYIFDMSPSYDARKLVFAYKKDVRKDSFHIYEINVDGTGLRQLTQGPFHDFSPVYLPDGSSPPEGGELGSLPASGNLRPPGTGGRICFNSTRVASFSLCQDFVACALYTIAADGSDMRRLEYNTLCDLTPFVMDDGSILFSRWEYQDKNIFCTEALWTINPDGSRLQLFYGNTLTIPNGLYGAKQIPGTRKVIAVGAAHHHRPLGSICIIDRNLGHENVAAIRNITPEVPYTPRVGAHWRETSWGPGDKLYPWSYTDPWPLAEDLFLVSYGGPMQGGPQRYRLTLMDDQGRKVELYDAKTTSCFNPVPLRPRPMPHRFAGTLPKEAKGEGRYFVV
ncbi:family 16 glycoside hydrolase, partial [Planctomycetota bacterium]